MSDKFRERDRELMRWVNRVADGQRSAEHEALGFSQVTDSADRLGVDGWRLRGHLRWRLDRWADQLRDLTEKEASRPWNAWPKSCPCIGCKITYQVISGLRAAVAWHASVEAAEQAALTGTVEARGRAQFAAERANTLNEAWVEAVNAANVAREKLIAKAAEAKLALNLNHGANLDAALASPGQLSFDFSPLASAANAANAPNSNPNR